LNGKSYKEEVKINKDCNFTLKTSYLLTCYAKNKKFGNLLTLGSRLRKSIALILDFEKATCLRERKKDKRTLLETIHIKTIKRS